MFLVTSIASCFTCKRFVPQLDNSVDDVRLEAGSVVILDKAKDCPGWTVVKDGAVKWEISSQTTTDGTENSIAEVSFTVKRNDEYFVDK